MPKDTTKSVVFLGMFFCQNKFVLKFNTIYDSDLSLNYGNKI